MKARLQGRTWREYGQETGRVHPWEMHPVWSWGPGPIALGRFEYQVSDGPWIDELTLDELDLSTGHIQGYRIPHWTDHNRRTYNNHRYIAR